MSFWDYAIILSTVTAMPLGLLFVYDYYYEHNKKIAEMLDKERERLQKEKEGRDQD